MLNISLGFSWIAGVLYVGGYNPFFLWVALTGMLGSVWSLPRGPLEVTRGPSWASSGLNLVMLAFFGSCLASYALSILPGISLDPMLAIASLPLTFWVSRYLLKREVPWADLSRPLWIAGAIVIVIAIPEFLVQHQRPFSTFGDANALAGFFNALLIPTYVTALADWQAGEPLRKSPLRLAVLVILILAVATTTSLSGQLCLAGGLTLATILSGVTRKKSWAMLLLFLAMFIPAYLFANHHATGREATSRLTSLNEQNSFTERVEMVKSTLEIYADGPWYGSGIGMYKTLYPAHRSVNERSTTGDLAHNDYAQFLAEGGPILLCSLLALLALTLWKIWSLFRFQRHDAQQRHLNLVTAGYAIAVLCLMTQAVMNFVFYVLPLSMLVGLFLARVDATSQPLVALPAKLPQPSTTRWPQILSATAIILLATMLGTRCLFIGLTTDACKLRVCNELRAKGEAGLALANLLATMQPTWLPARDHIVSRLKREAEISPEKSQAALEAAAKELARIIQDAPAVFYPYTTLAALIESTPSIAQVLPPNISNSPSVLYRMALDRYPQRQSVRLALAKTLEAQGQLREAYDLVNEDGMQWWRTALVTDAERIEMLRFLIPRAIGLGLCKEAKSMAYSLGIFTPDSTLAVAVVSQIEIASAEEAGCGIKESLPEQ